MVSRDPLSDIRQLVMGTGVSAGRVAGRACSHGAGWVYPGWGVPGVCTSTGVPVPVRCPSTSTRPVSQYQSRAVSQYQSRAVTSVLVPCGDLSLSPVRLSISPVRLSISPVRLSIRE